MAWFLLVAPLVNVAYFTIHALWISRLFFNIENQSSATMGRMFSTSNEKQAGADNVTQIINAATAPFPRHLLLVLEGCCAVFGYMLITFRDGANSQFCQPEVYWATTALVITVAVVIVFSALTFCLSILIGVYATAPWVQDFAGSFWENRLLAKAANLEQKEAQEAAAYVKAQESQAKFEADQEQNATTEWEDFQNDYADEREKHDAIMQEHYQYEEAASQAPPPRYAVETILPSALDEEPDELVIWGDDESEVPATMGPSMGFTDTEPTTMAGHMMSMDPSMVSQRFAMATLPPGTRPLNPQRISSSPAEYNVTGSIAALNAQVDSNPDQRWTSAGFATPFAQRPVSAPVLPASAGFVTASGRMPNTASTIYTEQPRGPFGNSV